jgi:hypothetical protein
LVDIDITMILKQRRYNTSTYYPPEAVRTRIDAQKIEDMS